MSYKAVWKEIENGKVSPVYLCYGTETYLLRQFVAAVTERLVPAESREFAVSRYDLAETPLDAVLDDAETLPFLVPRKVIVASHAQFFTGAKESSKVEHRTERLLDYLKAPADHTALLFTVEADKLDERKKLVKLLKESKCAVPFSPLSADELADWVRQRAKRLNFTLAAGAGEQLILFTGGHLQSIAGEMEKLSLHVGAGGTVTTDVIDNLVSRTTEQNVFLLIDEIVRLRLDRALAIFYELLKQKEEPIKIVVLMARQFRIIYQVKELERQGYSQQQIAGQVGVHPYAVKLAAEQAKGYESERLALILSRLAELDFRIKSGKTDKVLGLELFFMELAG